MVRFLRDLCRFLAYQKRGISGMANDNKAATLQMFPWATCVEAVKRSATYSDFCAFQGELPGSLPQNSPETRRRIANLIVKWYFPDHSLNQIPTLVWHSYQNEDILTDIMRMMTLEAEPVIARFVTEQVQVLEPGTELDLALARDFVTYTYGGFNPKTYERLLTTCRHLGFIRRQNDKWFVGALLRPDNAFLIALHARFAPSPRIVRLADILSSPFWRYLGLRAPDFVRAILRDAEAAGLISRYVTVDELEQITTRYAIAEYLERALRL